VNELNPTGTLRVGVASAPALSAMFVVKDAAGRPRGVTVDLATDLAAQLGAPLAFTVAANTGLLTDALEAGAIDVSFMPMDDERRKRIAFGPAYYLVESTYMATGASGIREVGEVDRAGVRVVGIANTTTIRAAGRSLKNTTITAATSIDEAVAMLHDGKADAFALSRDSLPPFVAALPGSRIVEGGFQHTGIAVAVGRDRSQALAFVTGWMERAKAGGVVRRALDAAGFQNEAVAPPV
jgi:polar amino acid transport system substrate-binding protein